MSGAASFGSASAPGSGRSVDLFYPAAAAPLPTNGTAVGVGTVCNGRPNLGAPSTGNTVSIGLTGVGSSAFWATGTGLNGRAAVQLQAGTGAINTGVQMTIDAMTMLPTIGAPAVNTDDSATDDFACIRCFAPMLFGTNNFGATADIGLFWTAANVGNFGIKGGGATGFGFCQTAADEISFIRRGPNRAAGIISTVVVKTSAADLLSWRTLEVRIIGATPTQEAKLIPLVNGRLTAVGTLRWQTDGLPTADASNGVYGFTTCFINRGAAVGATGVALSRLRFMVGPTEASLL